jgi:hypothetical protein
MAQTARNIIAHSHHKHKQMGVMLPRSPVAPVCNVLCATVLELGIGERGSLLDERCRIVVQDRVHPGKATRGCIFLLDVE